MDASDKIAAYRNWLGLMSRTLTATFRNGKKVVVRELQPDRDYLGTDGNFVILPDRSPMLVHNAVHPMTTDAVLDSNGDEVFEGILDAVKATACAIVDLKKSGKYRSSRTGSVYIVKPKMHGPAEAAFANTLFDRVEDLLGLERHTVKIGLMDEERRTTVNLAECVRAAASCHLHQRPDAEADGWNAAKTFASKRKLQTVKTRALESAIALLSRTDKRSMRQG